MEDRVVLRRRMSGHGSFLIWLTGLPGSGKTTLAYMLEDHLLTSGMRAFCLDGDHLRLGLSAGLDFSVEGRRENLRRAAEVARILVDAGCIVIGAFLSPFRADRQRLRARFAPSEFAEVHLRCPMEVCERRDPKGLYRLARAGLIAEFTGVSAPYEEPSAPELAVDTHQDSPKACLLKLMALVRELDGRQGREGL
ncbi:MAG: adenylyl-sulfate kinase [Holophaga sp.]